MFNEYRDDLLLSLSVLGRLLVLGLKTFFFVFREVSIVGLFHSALVTVSGSAR